VWFNINFKNAKKKTTKTENDEKTEDINVEKNSKKKGKNNKKEEKSSKKEDKKDTKMEQNDKQKQGKVEQGSFKYDFRYKHSKKLLQWSEVMGISSSAVAQTFYEMHESKSRKIILLKKEKNIFYTFFPLLYTYFQYFFLSFVKWCCIQFNFLQSVKYPVYTPYLDENNANNMLTPGEDEVTFADGGCVDNTGVLAILRRNVNKLIICYSNNIDIGIDETSNKTIEDNLYDIMALFGVCIAPNNFDSTEFNKVRQVFKEKDWYIVKNGLQNLRKKNDTLVYTITLDVVENIYCKVKAKKDVIVTFILNLNVKDWENELCSDYKKKLQPLQKLRTIDFLSRFYRWIISIYDAVPLFDQKLSPIFPYYSVIYQNYDDELVQTLSNLTCWSILNKQNDVKSGLKK